MDNPCSQRLKLSISKRQEILAKKALQNDDDFGTILLKGEDKRRAMSVQDVVNCRRLPILKTRLIDKKETPRSATKMDDITALSGSMTRSYATKSSMIVDVKELQNKYVERIKPRELIKNESENDRLARILKYMTDAREIIDSSRLMFEAAVHFDEMEMFERAIFCYQKSTIRVDPGLVVDTYDLPNDAKFQRSVKHKSKFQLKKFMGARNALRDRLIFLEDERQRLRERASHCNICRIHLLSELTNFPAAQKHLSAAFLCCSNETEHEDLLWYFHALLKDFSDTQRKELPLSKQIIRSTEGPLCDAHVQILLELQEKYPESTDVQEWLGFRYAEMNDYESAQRHFERHRKLREPKLEKAEALELWRSYFDPLCGSKVTTETDSSVGSLDRNGGERRGEGDGAALGAAAEKERTIQQAVMDNVSKKLVRSFDSYGAAYDSSDPRQTSLREDQKTQRARRFAGGKRLGLV